jgi:hypothetical protein
MTDIQYQTALQLFGQRRFAEGVQLLGQAAEAGHVPSMSLLGAQFLSGRGAPLDPIMGVRLIMAAAERGGGIACAMAAALHASGLKGHADWPRALDLLQRSAETGWPNAQAQLQLLSGQKGNDWGALRRAVDIEAWRKPPPHKVLVEAPRLWVFEAMASRAVCDWIINVAAPRRQPAKVFDQGTGGQAVHADRVNSSAELGLTEVDLVVLALRERLAAAAGAALTHMEGPQVLHYAVGQRFVAHHDYLDPANSAFLADIGMKGQRLATGLVYLNEGYEGGETEFPELGVRYKGAPGDALLFFSLDLEGNPDPRTLHAGTPPTAGEKWVLSQWIRTKTPPGVGDPRFVEAMG